MKDPRILLADADLPTRVGFRAALRRAGFASIDEVEDADTAVAAARTLDLDLALVHVALPGDGIAALSRMARSRATLRLVALTDAPGDDELLAAVLAGASGYLGTQIGASRLPEVVRGVLAGEVALPRRHGQRLLDELRRRATRRAAVAVPLTDREWEVLDLLTDGCSTSEMARRLRISEVTVRRHVSAVVAKLGVRDRAGAVELLADRSLP